MTKMFKLVKQAFQNYGYMFNLLWYSRDTLRNNPTTKYICLSKFSYKNSILRCSNISVKLC